ncbi:hypothetical protein D3C75_1231220 [compost metagenome]
MTDSGGKSISNWIFNNVFKWVDAIANQFITQNNDLIKDLVLLTDQIQNLVLDWLQLVSQQLLHVAVLAFP